MSDLLKCVVCGSEHPRGTDEIGMVGPEGDPDEAKHYPCCHSCYESDAHVNWRTKAIKALNEANVAFVSRGNLWEDYKELLSWLKHDERIKDGICPNGCARMDQVGRGDFECPVCHFGLSQRTL